MKIMRMKMYTFRLQRCTYSNLIICESSLLTYFSHFIRYLLINMSKTKLIADISTITTYDLCFTHVDQKVTYFFNELSADIYIAV